MRRGRGNLPGVESLPAITLEQISTTTDAALVRSLVLTVIASRLGQGHHPVWHADLDDPETYLRPGHAMFVARDAAGDIVASAGVRPGRDNLPPDLLPRYADLRRAEIVRVTTRPEWERHGLANSLVAACRQYVGDSGLYDVICLHTDIRSPGALDFWLAQGGQVVWRRNPPQPTSDDGLDTVVYLELDANTERRPGLVTQ